METFLHFVAKDLFTKLNGDFTNVAIVFPNRRAGLFFNEQLVRLTEKPIWAPTYISISDLFQHSSSWQIADTVKLVCELYKIYHNKSKSEETLDDFYHWGELLLSDFDDVDKNLADTDALFKNLHELHDLSDDYSFLEEGQKEALEAFFTNFSLDNKTELKSRFISIWNILGDIYTTFKHQLKAEGIAYEGMLYREVVQNLNTDALPYKYYVFVGFNVLNKVEQTLFLKLQAAGKALFYWDYDLFYLDKHPHEAGEFIRRNLKQFPNELPTAYFDNLRKEKKITYLHAATENAQARYLPTWIRENITSEEKETAVILCNEALLQPVLHALPDEVKHINITMGFPLQQTPTYSLINALLQLYTSGYNSVSGRFNYPEVNAVLTHPYIKKLASGDAEALNESLKENNKFYPLPSELQQSERLSKLFKPAAHVKEITERLETVLREVANSYAQTKPDENDPLDQLYRESLFKGYTLVNRFINLIDEGTLTVRPDTFVRLFTRVMSVTRIPFHGEPAIGLQVMGVLETRNLDFRHLILLSVNEGKLPQAGGTASFIPYNLRKAFGMTTIDHKIAVYAYYFYRMIQRAERITMVYNNTADGLNKGEQSRFMLQLLIDYPGEIQQQQIELLQSPQTSSPIEIQKDEAVMNKLMGRFDLSVKKTNLLSPSALNTYLLCPLKFYYRYVAGLKEADEVSIEIDASQFGTIFHQVAEWIYKDLSYRGGEIRKSMIEELYRNEIKLESYVEKAFKKHFFHIEDTEKAVYNGLQRINFAVILRYIKRLLELDMRHAPFQYVGSEQPIYETTEINVCGKNISLRWGGVIDRLDIIKDESGNALLRIVDYKTGGDAEKLKHLDDLFIKGKDRAKYVFQTFMYAAIKCKELRNEGKKFAVVPSLLYIHRAADKEKYSPYIQIGERKDIMTVLDFEPIEEDFRMRLNELIHEVFNPNISFEQTTDADSCSFCEFKNLCKR